MTSVSRFSINISKSCHCVKRSRLMDEIESIDEKQSGPRMNAKREK